MFADLHTLIKVALLYNRSRTCQNKMIPNCSYVSDAESDATDLLDNMFYEEENWGVSCWVSHA